MPWLFTLIKCTPNAVHDGYCIFETYLHENRSSNLEVHKTADGCA